MIVELNLNSPYKVYKDSDKNIYFFYTISGTKYIAYFTDANELFESFHLKDNIFQFGFEPVNMDKTPHASFGDNNIHLTIIALIKKFFTNKNNVLTFVADISDLKQKARNRLFQIWKQKYDVNMDFEKYDIEIETEEEIYYSSMIIHKDNIHKNEYRQAFLLTSEELNK